MRSERKKTRKPKRNKREPKTQPFNPTDPKAWARRPQNSPESAARMRAARAAKTTATTVKPSIVQSVVEEMGHSDDSPAQTAILKSYYGLPLTDPELDVWRRDTGRLDYPGRAFPELTLCTGAQSGKTGRIAAPIAVYEAIHGGHERLIKQGEPVKILLVSTDQDSARTSFGYVSAILDRPAFRQKVARVLADSILLKSGIEIVCVPSTKTAPRGLMIPVAVCDEIAFWRTAGSVNSDQEIVAAIRRGQLLIPGAKLIKISTAYAMMGVLFDDFQSYHGKDSVDVLTWRSTTAEMNPSVTAAVLDRMRRTMTPAQFRREFEGAFAADFTQFLSDAWINVADSGSALDLPRIGAFKYSAGVDASGGGADAFALSIAHRDGERIVQDLVRSWGKPRGGSVDLEGVVKEIASMCRSYGIAKVHGDRYAAGWVSQSFSRQGISYANPIRRERDGGETYLDRSMCYLETESLFAQGKVHLRSDERTLREFRLLERRPGQGRDRVDHPRGGSDDRANASAISFVVARGTSGLPRPMAGPLGSFGGADTSQGGVQNIDGPRRRTGGVQTGYGRVGGQAAWITTHYGRNR